MEEKSCELYANEVTGDKVAGYASAHSIDLPKPMIDHYSWATENYEKSGMLESPLLSQYQIFMARALGANRVLEIGTFIGFSGMGWSEAVGPEGHVTSLEYVPKYAQLAQETWTAKGFKNIEVIVGPAQESIKHLMETLIQPYDIIFIDADKENYAAYLSLILELSPPSNAPRLLKKGGLIMADNVLFFGLVADRTSNNKFWNLYQDPNVPVNDGHLDGLEKFNGMMKGEKRLDQFLMPLFDGLGLAVLKD